MPEDVLATDHCPTAALLEGDSRQRREQQVAGYGSAFDTLTATAVSADPQVREVLVWPVLSAFAAAVAAHLDRIALRAGVIPGLSARQTWDALGEHVTRLLPEGDRDALTGLMGKALALAEAATCVPDTPVRVDMAQIRRVGLDALAALDVADAVVRADREAAPIR